MRLFTAIALPGEIRDKLDSLVHDLRPTAKIKWSRAENLHVTTKFIGEWPAARLEQLNKEFRTEILISRSTWELVAGAVEARPMGPVEVRGFSEPVEIFAVTDLK